MDREDTGCHAVKTKRSLTRLVKCLPKYLATSAVPTKTNDAKWKFSNVDLYCQAFPGRDSRAYLVLRSACLGLRLVLPEPIRGGPHRPGGPPGGMNPCPPICGGLTGEPDALGGGKGKFPGRGGMPGGGKGGIPPGMPPCMGEPAMPGNGGGKGKAGGGHGTLGGRPGGRGIIDGG